MYNEELAAKITFNSYDLIFFLAGCPNFRYLLIY